MRTLYLTDLDGTLLTRKATLSTPTRAILTRLIAQGMPVSIATARSNYSALHALSGLPLALPCVMMDGAYLYEPRARVLSDVCTMDDDTARDALRALERRGIRPLVFAMDERGAQRTYYTTPSNDAMRAFLKLRLDAGDPRFQLVEALEPYARRVMNITCLEEREALVSALADFDGDTRFQTLLQRDTYPPYTATLQFDAPGCDKASGALRLKARLGARRLVVYGDGLNDLPLFSVADECYAVENAVPELKRAATAVIGDCEEDSVARHLETLWRRGL